MINEKLDEYSKQGDIQKFTDTFNELKDFFDEKIDSEKYKCKIYLQGSYGNNTNIKDESDVDIVIELTNVFYSNKNSLTKEQLDDFDSKYSNSNITVDEFKSHILSILRNTLKYSYKEKNKCIKITSRTILNADIIVCASYRHFHNYPNYIEGIKFYDGNGEEIISFPKKHKDNMTSKNKSSPNFKSTVRIFKNLKTELIKEGFINKENTSSYFVESLIYNVPNSYFTIPNLKERILRIITYAIESIPYEKMVTPCNMYDLFGKYEGQWSETEAINFLRNAYIIVRDG